MQTNHLSHFSLRNYVSICLKSRQNKWRGPYREPFQHCQKAGKKLGSGLSSKKRGDLGGNGASMFFGGGRWVRYGQTKLANAAFTACLHEKLQASGSKIKALVAHPGLAETDLQSTTVREGGMGEWFTKQLMKTGQSREDGALGILTCMAHSNVQSGQFFGPGMGGMFSALKGPAKGYPLKLPTTIRALERSSGLIAALR